MSLMYKLIEERKNQRKEKIAEVLIESGVKTKRVIEITGLSRKKVKKMSE
mgnify:CR=1 FL=1